MTNHRDEDHAIDLFASRNLDEDRDETSLLATIPASSIAMQQMKKALIALNGSAEASAEARRITLAVLAGERPLAHLLADGVIPQVEVSNGANEGPDSDGLRWG